MEDKVPPQSEEEIIYPWAGLPVCKHGYQIDCTECMIESGEYEIVPVTSYVLRKKVKPSGPDDSASEKSKDPISIDTPVDDDRPIGGFHDDDEDFDDDRPIGGFHDD